MANGKTESAAAGQEAGPDIAQPDKEKVERREIKGGIPYVVAPGVLKKSLELIIPAERPDKFGTNYMTTILKLTGGAARAVPPFLKKMQFIGADGTPTILYSKFKTDSGRSQAAYEGLKNAFGELFKRNEYIYKAEESAVRDVIVEITGLKKNDPIIRMMYSSFDAVRGFINGDVSGTSESINSNTGVEDDTGDGQGSTVRTGNTKLNLSYQINIVMPETENIAVFNAIFKSLRENLLR